MPLLNIYPRGQFLLADHRNRAGEEHKRRQGGQVRMGTQREKVQLSKFWQFWERLGLDENPRALTNGAWVNKERRCDLLTRFLTRESCLC